MTTLKHDYFKYLKQLKNIPLFFMLFVYLRKTFSNNQDT